jgi:hypothetical protein
VTDYTVILADSSEHPTVPRTRVVQVEAHSPEDAASIAEVTIASETWHRRYPEMGEPENAEPRMDDEWIDCMESVGTLTVIEGHPQTFTDDEIYQ